MNLTILYRGPLKSCNYACWYCPFAKRKATEEELTADKEALERFVNWAKERTGDTLSILFTPWGEALTWHYYQQALVTLSQMPHVQKVVIQTNLSCNLEWIIQSDKRSLALWATYHPTQTTRADFLAQCRTLEEQGVRFSAGCVGIKEDMAEIEALRRELSPNVYLWVNAYKHEEDYYTTEDLARLTAVDPHFPLNTHHYPSRGRPCRCGHSVISVDGAGTIRRCHFIKEPIGNLYAPGFEKYLRPTPCTNATCHCHIGYVHMNELGLYEVFEDGVLERIPSSPPQSPPEGGKMAYRPQSPRGGKM